MKQHQIFKLLTLMCLLLLPAFAAYWHWNDLSLPRNDEAYNLEFAQRIWWQLQTESPIKFLKSLYLERSMRPIVLTPLGSISFLMTSGQMELVRLLFGLLGSVLYSLFLYQLLRRYTQGFQLLTLVVFLTSIPWVVKGVQDFSPELFALAFLIKFFDLFLKVQSSPNHTPRTYFFMGARIGIVCLFRPIEPLLIFVTFTIWLLFIESKRSPQDRIWLILSALIFSFLFGGFFLFQILKKIPAQPFQFYFLIVFSSFVLISRIWALNRWPSQKLIFYFLGFATFAFLWYGPYGYSLYQWAFESSFGGMAKITGLRGENSVFQFLIGNISQIFGIGLGLPIFVFMMTSTWREQKFRRQFGQLMLAISPIWLVGAMTSNSDPRYYLYSSLLLLIFLGAHSLSNFQKNSLYRSHVVLLLGALNWQSSLATIFPIDSVRWLSQPTHFLTPRSAQKEIDPLLLAYHTFKSELPKLNSTICILQMKNNTVLDYVLDPWSLTMLSRQERKSWEFVRPFPHRFSNAQERFEQIIQKECHYVFVFPIQFVPSPNEHFMSDVGELVLSWKTDQALKDHGLKLLDKFEFSSHPWEDFQGIGHFYRNEFKLTDSL